MQWDFQQQELWKGGAVVNAVKSAESAYGVKAYGGELGSVK